VPAGTGFYLHQEAEVRIRPEALQELQAEKERILEARMSLLNEVGGAAPSAPPVPSAPSGTSTVLDIHPDDHSTETPSPAQP
jgi:DNA-directed RNA polymerase subunit beta'